MNETELHEQLERASTGVDGIPDPDGLWAAGTRRRRTRQALAVGAVAASVALTIAVTTNLTGHDTRPDSIDVPTPTVPTEAVDPLANREPVVPIADDQVQPVFDPAELESVSWREGSGPRSWDPVDTVPLADDPVERASVVVQSTPDQPPAISILGDDERWRSLDVSGMRLPDSYDYHLGIALDSLSPDGTRLAIGQKDGVLVVDLTTADRTMYDVPDLGPVWESRYTSWSADGSVVFLGRGYMFERPAWAIDLVGGGIRTVPFDPTHSVALEDGFVLEDHWREATGTDLRLYDEEDKLVQATAEHGTGIGVFSFLSANGERVAALCEQTSWTDPDGEGPLRSGVLVMDTSGHPEALLPVKGYENHGGGGAVLGWLDDDTVLFRVSRGEDHPSSVLAWQIESGGITRVADYSWTLGLSVTDRGL